ncbi:MAG TPA: hypothetical protein VIL30_17570 [Ramlibacter sp.]
MSEVLKATLRHSITLTELQHTYVQLRFAAILLGGSVLFDLIDPALLLLGSGQSFIYRAASLTALGSIGTALLFLTFALLLLPFLALQIGICPQCRRGGTQLACLALTGAGLLWFFLAWRCIPLDIGTAPIVFARNGAGTMLFALALAYSLNAEQLRCSLERPC